MGIAYRQGMYAQSACGPVYLDLCFAASKQLVKNAQYDVIATSLAFGSSAAQHGATVSYPLTSIHFSRQLIN